MDIPKPLDRNKVIETIFYFDKAVDGVTWNHMVPSKSVKAYLEEFLELINDGELDKKDDEHEITQKSP